MDKPLLKLYGVILILLALAIVFLPMVIGQTSKLTRLASTSVQLAAYQNSSQATKPPSGPARANVLIVMDDGWKTQYSNGYRVLKAHGFKASIGVITDFVGQPGYMNYEELAEVYMDGWDLINYSSGHIDLTSLSEEQQIGQMNRARTWLADHMMERGKNILMFPNGQYTSGLLETANDQGYSIALSLSDVYVNGRKRGDVAVCNLISGFSFEEAAAAIDEAIGRQSTVIFIIHKIEPVTDGTQMQLSEAKFCGIIEYISSRKDALDVLTMTEWLDAIEAGEAPPQSQDSVSQAR